MIPLPNMPPEYRTEISTLGDDMKRERDVVINGRVLQIQAVVAPDGEWILVQQ